MQSTRIRHFLSSVKRAALQRSAQSIRLNRFSSAPYCNRFSIMHSNELESAICNVQCTYMHYNVFQCLTIYYRVKCNTIDWYTLQCPQIQFYAQKYIALNYTTMHDILFFYSSIQLTEILKEIHTISRSALRF